MTTHLGKNQKPIKPRVFRGWISLQGKGKRCSVLFRNTAGPLNVLAELPGNA